MLPAIQSVASQRPALMLAGPRQAGKSTALRQAFSNHRYVSLDLPHVADLAEEAGAQFLQRYPPPVIVDEVQYAPVLLRHIKADIDAHRDENGRYILTGSQQFHLNQSGAESLAGRVGILNLNSLSLHELERAFGTAAEGDRLLHWILAGGYPEIHAKGIDAELFFSGYIPTYLERDIRHVVQVRNAREFNRFLRLLAARTGQMASHSSIATDLGLSPNTVKTWTDVLEGAGVIRFCEPYFNNFGKRIVKTPKIYFLDTGLVCFLLGLHSIQALRESALYGHIFETLAFGQLVRSFTHLGKQAEIYFYRDHHGKEVDFVVPNEGRLDI